MKRILILAALILFAACPAFAQWDRNVDKIHTETLTASKTLGAHDHPVQHLDPNGADRDVTLPPEEVCRNTWFMIYNDADAAGEDLVVKNDAGTELQTLQPGMTLHAHSNGTTWVGKIMLPTGTLLADGQSGAVVIPATDPSKVANLESGVSPVAINGNTTLTSADLNRVYTIRLAASPIIKISSFSIGQTFVLADNTRTGNDSGATVWVTQAGASIVNNSGALFDTGTTLWWLSGNTGQVTQLYAIDSNTLKVISSDATLRLD